MLENNIVKLSRLSVPLPVPFKLMMLKEALNVCYTGTGNSSTGYSRSILCPMNGKCSTMNVYVKIRFSQPQSCQTRDAPDTDFAGYPGNLNARYRITGTSLHPRHKYNKMLLHSFIDRAVTNVIQICLMKAF
jgi:hypothetical protein